MLMKRREAARLIGSWVTCWSLQNVLAGVPEKKQLKISAPRAQRARFGGSILTKCATKISVETHQIDSAHSPLSIGAPLNNPLEIKNVMRKKSKVQKKSKTKKSKITSKFLINLLVFL